MKLTVVSMVKADIPTPNGRVYSKECLEKALKDFKKKLKKQKILGTTCSIKYNLPELDNRPLVDLSEATHEIKRIIKHRGHRRGEYSVEIMILDTPKGNLAKQMIGQGYLTITPVGVGKINDGFVEDYEMIRQDLTLIDRRVKPTLTKNVEPTQLLTIDPIKPEIIRKLVTKHKVRKLSAKFTLDNSPNLNNQFENSSKRAQKHFTNELKNQMMSRAKKLRRTK